MGTEAATKDFRRVTCVHCGKQFSRHKLSRRTLCSDECEQTRYRARKTALRDSKATAAEPVTERAEQAGRRDIGIGEALSLLVLAVARRLGGL